MRHLACFLTFVTCVVLSAPVTGAMGSAHTHPRLSPKGLGPLEFGISAARAGRLLGTPVTVENGINGCSFWSADSFEPGTQVIAFGGRLGFVLLYERGTATTRGVRVGDGVKRLKHRYRGRLHPGRSASLGAADERLFVGERQGGAVYELEFDIVHGRVAFISAASRHTIETFGECA
jgi:hypothetical protein